MFAPEAAKGKSSLREEVKMKHKIASIVLGAVLSALFTTDALANRACCFPDGTCGMVREREACTDFDGVIQGRGITCADNPCDIDCEDLLAACEQELEQALADLARCQKDDPSLADVGLGVMMLLILAVVGFIFKRVRLET